MNHPRLVAGLTVLLAGVVVCIGAVIVGPFAVPSLAAGSVSETRDVSGFDRIRLEGAFTTEITAGKDGTAVVISGNRDLVGRVTTEVNGDTLVVGMHGSGFGFFEGSPKIEITLPVLRGFSNSGAGSATIAGLTGGDIEIENAGAGSIVATGLADREDVTLAGVGTIDTTGLDAQDVTVSNDGVGSVHVRASGNLTMNVDGVGEIRYAGTPAHIESEVNGIGKIGRL
jgi:Putative auto-transporter adhesin, head GIN domain